LIEGKRGSDLKGVEGKWGTKEEMIDETRYCRGKGRDHIV